MSAIYLLVFASICVAGIFLAAFIWCVQDNQLEDQIGAAMRILHEDDEPENKTKKDL